jgi:hypothetical protein
MEEKAGSTDHNLPQRNPIWKQDHVNQQSQVPNTSSNSLWVKAVTGIQNRLCWVTHKVPIYQGGKKPNYLSVFENSLDIIIMATPTKTSIVKYTLV